MGLWNQHGALKIMADVALQHACATLQIIVSVQSEQKHSMHKRPSSNIHSRNFRSMNAGVKHSMHGNPVTHAITLQRHGRPSVGRIVHSSELSCRHALQQSNWPRNQGLLRQLRDANFEAQDLGGEVRTVDV